MAKVAEPKAKYADEVNLEEWAKILEQQMRDAAKNLDFERAALLRDELLEIRVKLGQTAGSGHTS
jgi:excinuclease ABC subunit B